MTRKRIYLDHAATSWPKNPAIFDAMDRYARQCGAASGRGQYRSAIEAEFLLRSVRRQLAETIGAESPDSIALFCNGTMAINAGLFGILRDGDHVVTTAAEHNSVLRPLFHLQTTKRITLSIVPCDLNGIVDARELMSAVKDDTRLVALTSASNVTGAEQPIAEVGEFLKQRPTLFFCDAAQTFGYLPIDVRERGIDLLAAPGHKGGCGPQGTGFLYVAPEHFDSIKPVVFGGTGSQSESLEMPAAMPGKLEPGNLNVAAVAGWNAGLSDRELFHRSTAASRSIDKIADRLHSELREIERVRVFGRAGRLPVVSLKAENFLPQDLAVILDAEFGIEVRAGLHCAALVHSFLGSEGDGTLRISASHCTTDGELDSVIEAIRQIVSAE